MKNDDNYYVEVGLSQRNHDQERICGDVFISEKLKAERRMIAVLSDGMGHGVKANILATLTATMGKAFTKEKKPFYRIAEVILNTLPTSKELQMSYATFTIIDMQLGGVTQILEYGNPQTMIFRGKTILDPHWTNVVSDSPKVRSNELKMCTFEQKKGDRIISFSDGVMQSGMGHKNLLGWEHSEVEAYIGSLINNDANISAATLSRKVVNMAYMNDNYKLKDDTTCSVIYLRTPRRLLIFTGPPFDAKQDKKVAEYVKNFEGKKIVSGATTVEILARELGIDIYDDIQHHATGLPPSAKMDGIDLVTEGVLTLSVVAETLNNYHPLYALGYSPADQIVKMLLDSDDIVILIGTQVNQAHLDPTLPTEIEIRRTVVRRIVSLLEDKFLKDVEVNYV